MALQTKTPNYKIPNTLSHSAGTITAVFDSGSRQVVLSGLAANTLYFLYMRTVAGTPTLFFSTSIPSVYRVSFSDAITIGAFYSNGAGSPAFGSFVKIEGLPVTENPIDYVPTGTFTTNTTYSGKWTRRGDRGFVDAGASFAGAPNAVTWSDFTLPFTVDTAKLGQTSPNVDSYSIGDGKMEDAAAEGYFMSCDYQSSTMFQPIRKDSSTASLTTAAVTNTSPFTIGSGDRANFKVDVPVSGWGNGPLKDL